MRVDVRPIPILVGLFVIAIAHFGSVSLFDRVMSRYVIVTDV